MKQKYQMFTGSTFHIGLWQNRNGPINLDNFWYAFLLFDILY